MLPYGIHRVSARYERRRVSCKYWGATTGLAVGLLGWRMESQGRSQVLTMGAPGTWQVLRLGLAGGPPGLIGRTGAGLGSMCSITGPEIAVASGLHTLF